MANIKTPAIGVIVNDKRELESILNNKDGVMIVFKWNQEIFDYLNKIIDLRSELFVACIFDEVTQEIMDQIKNSKLKYLNIAMLSNVIDIELSSQYLKVLEQGENNLVIKCIATFNVSLLQVSLLIEKTGVSPLLSVLELHPSLAQVFAQNYLEDLEITLGSFGAFSNIDDLKVISSIASKLNTNGFSVVSKWLQQRHIFNFIDFCVYDQYFEEIDLSIKLKMSDVNEINDISCGLRLYPDPENIC